MYVYTFVNEYMNEVKGLHLNIVTLRSSFQHLSV